MKTTAIDQEGGHEDRGKQPSTRKGGMKTTAIDQEGGHGDRKGGMETEGNTGSQRLGGRRGINVR